jgi:hypothetical protein
MVDLGPEDIPIGLNKGRVGFQDSRRLSIPDAVLMGGNNFAGDQEGLLVYWAGVLIDLQILKQGFHIIAKRASSDNIVDLWLYSGRFGTFSRECLPPTTLITHNLIKIASCLTSDK